MSIQYDGPARIRRGRRNARYTAICNEIIDHPTLSPEAKIALIYLLSKPDDWQLQINDIRRLLGTGGRRCGRNKAYEVIKELKASAYIVAVEELRNGRFHRLTYYVFDEPLSDPAAFKAELRGERTAKGTGDVQCAETTPKAPRPGIRETVASSRPGFRDPEKRHVTKDRITQTTEIPPPSPVRPRRASALAREAADLEFSKFWADWPEADRPRAQPLAGKLFAGLAPAERRMAVQFAHAYRTTRGRTDGFAPMITYLREQLFVEFDGAPEIDSEGYYVITRDRPEWSSWMDHLRGRYSAEVVEREAARGWFLRPKRWPPTTAETGASVPPDTASFVSQSDTPSPHADRAFDGAIR